RALAIVDVDRDGEARAVGRVGVDHQDAGVGVDRGAGVGGVDRVALARVDRLPEIATLPDPDLIVVTVAGRQLERKLLERQALGHRLGRQRRALAVAVAIAVAVAVAVTIAIA